MNKTAKAAEGAAAGPHPALFRRGNGWLVAIGVVTISALGTVDRGRAYSSIQGEQALSFISRRHLSGRFFGGPADPPNGVPHHPPLCA